MKPSNISFIRAKVYGGESRGAVTTLTPVSIHEVNTFLKEAAYFLATGDARMIELHMQAVDGQTELRNLYKAGELPVVTEEEDPFSRFYAR